MILGTRVCSSVNIFLLRDLIQLKASGPTKTQDLTIDIHLVSLVGA